jgi:hypothetical protein
LRTNETVPNELLACWKINFWKDTL